jgi:hypothetical protein
VCGVFGPFLFPYVLAFYTTVLMVVVTYCGGRYLVIEIGLLGYRKMSNLFKCLTPQIMSRCSCNAKSHKKKKYIYIYIYIYIYR